MTDNAFTDNPPQGFLPFSQKIMLGVASLLKSYGVELEDIPHFLGAYHCISNGNRAPSRQEAVDAYWDMDEEAVNEVLAYINRVQERKEAATVDVEQPAG